MDSILLERGFHIAYINTNDLYGHPQAMMAWDNFYEYLVQEKQFAPKVALEGVSRGGLYVYGWAKRNPAKVSCIYAEAPVCNIKSWPGGKGKGPGSSSDWKKLLALYGFTDEQAMQFADNPIDNLEGLAAFKVPIVHVIGLNDSIVPNEENTFILVNNYIKKGGPATVIPMTGGKQSLQGHHFPIENPASLADFITKNSVPVAQPLSAMDFIELNGNLSNFLYRVQHEKKATVAFLGGSITYNKGWRDKVSQYLQELYPQTTFTFIKAGIPSLGSLPHAFRLNQDVLSKGRIDLLFVESAVNDYANGTDEIIQRRALEGIVRHAYQANPGLNIVMMAFADEFKLADYKANKQPKEVQVHQQVAKAYNIPFINLALEVSKRIDTGEFTWEYDFKDLHPSPFGQEIYFQTIKTLLRYELNGKAADKLTKAKLPEPVEKSNYASGDYISIQKAEKKTDFHVDPSWKPADSADTREGFVHVPMLIGEKPGASFEFPFEGNAVGIALISGPDAGKIAYSIDGGTEKTIDLYTQWSWFIHLPWYLLLADELSKGKHTLKLRIGSESNPKSKGNACRIVHLLVNKTSK
jgi:sialidase-1